MTHQDFDGWDAPPAEAATIGAMLLSRAAIEDAISVGLTADHFASPAAGIVYDTITGMHTAGIPVDVVTCADALAQAGVLHTVGGATKLHDWVGRVPMAASVAYYAQIVTAGHVARTIDEVGRSLVDAARGGSVGTDTAAGLVAGAYSSLDSVAAASTARRVSTAEAVEAALASLHTREQVIATPWPDLDEVFPGWRPAELTAFMGRPGDGKTVGLMQAAAAAAKGGVPTVVFSLEMTMEQTFYRLLASETGISTTAFSGRSLDERQWDRVESAAERIASWPLVVIDGEDRMTVPQMRSIAAAEGRRIGGAGLVVVDHLGLVRPSETRAGASTVEQLTEITRAMKLWAKCDRLPVLVAVQLNRSSVGGAPRLDQAYGSDSIGQNVDNAIALEIDPDVAGEVKMHVLKHRQGPTGVTAAADRRHCARFDSMAGWGE